MGHCVDGSGCCALGALFVESHAMGLLTFGLNVTLDGCIDHTQGIVDDELHDYWTQLLDQSGAMLFGRKSEGNINALRALAPLPRAPVSWPSAPSPARRSPAGPAGTAGAAGVLVTTLHLARDLSR